MGYTVRVRQGGDTVAVWRDYTSMVAGFDVEDSSPLIQGGNSLEGGLGEFIIIDDASLIPANPPDNSIAAHNVVEWYDDGPGFNCWLMRGRIGSKQADRGDHPWGDSRTWHVNVEDAQADIRGLALGSNWVRGSETDVARVQAALTAFCNGSPRVSTVISQHLISSAGTVTMPAKTYEAGTELGEIFEDCLTTAGKIAGVVTHHSSTSSHLCFLYIDELDHTTYRSPLRISDVPADHSLTAGNLLLSLAGASIKVSSEDGSFPKTNAVDGNVSTHWSETNGVGIPDAYWAGDLGSSTQALGWRLRQTGTANDAPTSGILYGSNSGAAWTWLPAGKIAADPTANGWTQVSSYSSIAYPVDTGKIGFAAVSYRYWMFRATDGPAAGDSDCDIGEIELFTGPTLPPQWLGTPSDEQGNHLASKIVSRWGNGQVVTSDLGATQVDAYDYWARPYFDEASVTAAQAALRAAAVLNDWHYEHVTHQVTITLPATMLDLVTTGQSIQIKAAAAMGGQYLGTWQTRRVAAHRFEPAAPSATAATRMYDVHLELDRPMRVTGRGVISGAGVSAASKAGLAATGVKNNYAATTAPTTGDDADDGYSVGSHWIDTSKDQVWLLVDATVGTAIWAPLTVFAWKAPVRVATTAAGTLASSFENGDTVDGVVLATSDRILIKDQATGSENGIYTVNASGAPTRATDMDASTEVLGAAAFVSEGTANGNKIFICTTNAPITLGTTALVFADASSGGGVTDHGALTGLGDDDHTQYLLESIFDAKGDLVAASAADTPAKLTVGADGKVLSADSAEATGLKWVTIGDVPAGDLVQLGTGEGSIRIPGLKAHAGKAGLGGGGITEEYGTTTTGLTWDTSPSVTIDSDTTVPDHLFAEHASGGAGSIYGLRAFAPGAAAFSARLHVAVGLNDNAGTISAGLMISASGSTPTSAVTVGLNRPRGVVQIIAASLSGSTWTQRNSTWNGSGVAYLRIDRPASSDVWSFYWSDDGRVWNFMGTHTLAITVAQIGYRFAFSGAITGRFSSDFLRTDV